MIPIKLSLRNFMCYRDTEVLDLTGIHLACLSGENGAGKSAILESLTWSLWGKARDRSFDDELISKGTSEMEVDYHFSLGSEHYRVIRKRSRKGQSGTTMLDIMVSPSGEEGTWRTLSGATQRETQARINETLKIDYETFINSAFILQGRADEFTVKNPAERKKVLTEILGLAQYDRLEERAKDEARDRKARMMELENTIKRIDGELLLRPAYAQELETVEAQLFEAQNSLVAVRGECAQMQAQYQALEHSRSRLKELQERISKRETRIDATNTRIGQNSVRKQEFETILAQRAEIEDGFARWQAAQAQERLFNESLATQRRLETERGKWEREIDAERIRLTSRVQQHEGQIATIERRLAGRDIVVQQLAEVVEKLHSLEKLQEQHEDTRCQREAIEVRLRTLNTEKETLKREGEQLSQKLKLITEAHAESKGHVGCPLCGTGLTAEALERVRLSYESDIAEKRQEYKRKQKQLDEVNAEFVAIEKKLAQEREQLKPLAVFRQREAKMQQDLRRMDEEAHDVERERSGLMQIRATLDKNEYAPEARRMLLAVTAEMGGLAYDEDEHRAATSAVAELRAKDYDGRYHKLASAERELQALLQYLEEDRHNLEAWKAEQERERAEVATLQPQVEQLTDLAQSLAAKQREEAHLASTASSLSESRGGLRNKLLRCDQLQEDKARYAAEYQTAVEEKVIYDELAVAFGKKGIQAMIIENVIPEVEQEANALLHRMTDGRMSVQFATQRDAKSSKNVIETLDINISDEIGIRPYELYSGGEAFRVNFALRIALSKLLARRAGAQLQTLVIDEGFGSQDGQGREKLVSAIRSIEGDFEKILVITHIEELKDEFPVRINVVKTATGSRIIVGEA